MTKSVKSHICDFSWGLPCWKISLTAAATCKKALFSLISSLLATLVMIPVLKTLSKQLKSENSLYKTDIVWVIIAKSDEIGKIAHLAFSLEICGGWHIGKTLFNHCCHLEFSPISSLLAMLVTIPVLFPVLKESPRGRLKGVSEQVSLWALLKVTKLVKSHILTISWGLPYWKISLSATLVMIPVLKTPFKRPPRTRTLF